MSQPTWAAWIEIISITRFFTPPPGRSPLGLRGLKFWMHEYQKAYQDVAALLGCVD